MPLNKQKQYQNNPPKKNKTGDTRKNKNPKKTTQKAARRREGAAAGGAAFLRFFFVVFDFFWCLLCVLFLILGGYFGIVFVFLGALTLSLYEAACHARVTRYALRVTVGGGGRRIGKINNTRAALRAP